jgi:hypothetical protein
MALTLDEAKSLIAALGVSIPEALLDLKAKAVEFRKRREEVAAAASGKPADWRLKADFDDVLNRAAESAGQQQFEQAFKQLDEAGQLLQQPDVPPAPVAPAEPATPQPAELKAAAAFDEPEFQKQWAAAKRVWIESLETIDQQLDQVRAKMLACGDPKFKIVADLGLPALTENHKTPVMKGVFELNGPPGDARNNAALKTQASILAFRTHLNSSHLIRALDEHSKVAFGVQMTLRAEIAKGLSALEEAIRPLLAG